MRYGLTLLCLCALVTSVAAAPMELGTTVTAVDKKLNRATINRGKRGGLAVGVMGNLLAMRTHDGDRDPMVADEIRIARGTVVEVADDTAVLALDAVVDTVEVGLYFSYDGTVPDDVAASPMVRIAGLGIDLRSAADKAFFTFYDVLQDRTGATSEKVLDAMVADLKAQRATFAKSSTKLDGRYKGKESAQVIDELTRVDVVGFLLFLDAYPGRYKGRTYPIVELFSKWLRNGGDNGDRNRKLRAVEPTMNAAFEAMAVGKLDEADRLWRTILKTVPDHSDARRMIRRIERVQLAMRQVAADPEDTGGRESLIQELYNFEAYALALEQTDALAKTTFDKSKVQRWRANILTQLGRWADAEREFAAIAKADPDNKSIATWLGFVRASARAAKNPSDVAAQLVLAQLNEDGGSTSDALQIFRRVAELKTATPRQREIVKLAQERIFLLKAINRRIGWAKEDIQEHALPAARKEIDAILKMLDQLHDEKRATRLIAELAATANALGETDLWVELASIRTKRDPNDHSATVALALAQLDTDRIDDAAATIKRVEGVKQVEHSYLVLTAFAARARGDIAAMEKLATKGMRDAKLQPWPGIVLAQVEGARGDWTEAVDHARKMLALHPDHDEVRATLAAAHRGQQAHDALAANPKSARERLRLVRALADLGMVKRATEEIAKLPADGEWRSDGWWSIVQSKQDRVPLRDRLAAVKNVKLTDPERVREARNLEARVRLLDKPTDEPNRLVVARMFLESSEPHKCLATLGPLRTTTATAQVTALIADAAESLRVRPMIDLAAEEARRGDYKEALEHALAYQQVADRTGDWFLQFRGREQRASILVDQGKDNDAIAILEESRKMGVSVTGPRGASLHNLAVARAQANLGPPDALQKALEDDLKLCTDLDDERCTQLVHSELATLFEGLGKLAEALDHGRLAWSIADRTGQADNARIVRAQMAKMNASAGRTADSDRLALVLLADSRKASDASMEKSALLLLGQTAMMRGQGQSARARFQEVYELGTRTGSTWARAVARESEGWAWLFADHEPAKAVKAFDQSATLFASMGTASANTSLASIMRGLARAHIQTGNLAAARQAAEKALALAEPRGFRVSIAWAQTLLAEIIVEQNQADDALARAKTAVELAKQTDAADLLGAAFHTLARAQALKAQDKDALASFELSLQHMNRALLATGGEADQDGYMKTGEVRDMYKRAVAHMIKVGETARAMEVLEQSRDAQLKRAVDATKVQTKDPAVRTKLDRYEEKRVMVNSLEEQLADATNKPAGQRNEARIKGLSKRIAKTREEMNAIANELKSTHPNLYGALAITPDALFARKDSLPKGSVVVEYFVADDALFAFVVSAALKQPTVVRVAVTSAQLASAVAEFREAVIAENGKTKARDKVEELGRKLDDWLLDPLRPHLTAATTVIVIPFGSLYYVPFDALVVSRKGDPVRYAIEDFRISVQSKTTLEALLKAPSPRRTGTMLAVANPDGSLAGAQREVSRIVKTIPDARVLVRKDGTVQKFKDSAGAFRLLHLATHGVIDADPRKSYLKLADGTLTVRDIAKLQLDGTNEMVVLSACESATEKEPTTSDELITLSVAFAVAGAPTLVASLWEVGDDSTAELMATFYRALEAASGDRLDALRNAKLGLLRLSQKNTQPYAQPWHWASFQLFGDFRAPSR